jgi:hypothetical protein
MAVKFHIDFSRPIALFPLAGVAIYPHTADWIRVFEPRYRQMVEDCLRARGDGPLLDAAPNAMASSAGRDWAGERVGDPPLRKAVCVAKIVEHRLDPVCPILFSWVAPLSESQRDKVLKPVPKGLTPISRKELVEAMVADRVPARFQLQMHKFIWPSDERGV